MPGRDVTESAGGGHIPAGVRRIGAPARHRRRSQSWKAGETLALPHGPRPETMVADTDAVSYPHPRRNPGGAHRGRRVRDLLRSRLLAGEFGLERLPDDEHLMKEYHVGRGAIRTALSALQREGLIDRKQGAGTFPICSKAQHRLVHANGLGASISTPWLRMASRLVAVEDISASPEVARELGTEVGARCLAVDSVTSIDDSPAVVLTSYLADPDACDRVRSVVGAGLWSGDWYDALAQADLVAERRDVVLEAVAVDELIAPFLGVAVGVPAMRFQRRLSLGPERVREYGFSYCRGDLVAFTINDRPRVPEGSHL
jgi:GntR family transcriptional regulator